VDYSKTINPAVIRPGVPTASVPKFQSAYFANSLFWTAGVTGILTAVTLTSSTGQGVEFDAMNPP
jgi:hypothetical protein